GLLQPLVVRPIGRRRMLVARFLAAAGVCAVYVFVVYLVAIVITGTEGSWYPQDVVTPGLLLAGAVVLMTATSLLGSVFLGGAARPLAIGSRPCQRRRPGTRSRSNQRQHPLVSLRKPQRSASTSTRWSPCSTRCPGFDFVCGSGKKHGPVSETSTWTTPSAAS